MAGPSAEEDMDSLVSLPVPPVPSRDPCSRPTPPGVWTLKHGLVPVQESLKAIGLLLHHHRARPSSRVFHAQFRVSRP